MLSMILPRVMVSSVQAQPAFFQHGERGSNFGVPGKMKRCFENARGC